MTIFKNTVFFFCELLILVLFIRSMMAVVIRNQESQANNLFFQVTEPILAPLRRVLPKFGVVDYTPFVAIVILGLIALLISLIP